MTMVDFVGNIAVVVLVVMLVCVVASVVIVRRARRKHFLELQRYVQIRAHAEQSQRISGPRRLDKSPAPREHWLNKFASISIQYIGNNPRTK